MIYISANIYQVNNQDNRKRCEICSRLTIKTPEDTLLSARIYLLGYPLLSHHDPLKYNHIYHIENIQKMLLNLHSLILERKISSFPLFRIKCRLLLLTSTFLAGIYLFEVNNRKQLNNIWNLFKVNNKDTRTTSVTQFWYLYC